MLENRNIQFIVIENYLIEFDKTQKQYAHYTLLCLKSRKGTRYRSAVQ